MAASRVLPVGAEAKRVIHDNDTGRLKDLLTAHPALVSWRDEDGHTLLFMATGSFGDAGDDFREQSFTRLACAEILIDAGAEVDRDVLDNVTQARAHHMLAMLARKNALPPTIEYLAATGNLDAIRRVLDDPGALQRTRDTLDRAFLNACRFQHKDVAAFLLDRMIEVNRELGARIESGPGRTTFIDRLCEYTEEHGSAWQTYLYNEILQTVQRGDRVEFERWLRREPHLLGEHATELQVKMIERAVINNQASMIEALFDHDPAILRASPPPASSAIAFAFEYAKTHLLPLLTRVWPIPDDLAHAAGLGDFDRVKGWFDSDGRPQLGDLSRHHPANQPHWRGNLQWGPPTVQQVLDVALAWACLNNHLDIAAFLLEHGADINTTWSSHEPASILHELVWHKNYEAMQFLIDRGIDMTTLDYRWNATAEGWARYAAKDDKLADFLANAGRRR
jgi:ankyrin repeat protein